MKLVTPAVPATSPAVILFCTLAAALCTGTASYHFPQSRPFLRLPVILFLLQCHCVVLVPTVERQKNAQEGTDSRGRTYTTYIAPQSTFHLR